MNSHPTRRAALALGSLLALGLAGCASAPPPAATGPDPALLARLDAVLRQATPGNGLRLLLARDTLRTGEALQAQLYSQQDGYAYLVQLGTEGRSLGLVFPNAVDIAHRVSAGSSLNLPRPEWRMALKGPAGVGYLLAFVTPKPLDLLALQAQLAQGRLEIAGAYGAAMVSYRELAP